LAAVGDCNQNRTVATAENAEIVENAETLRRNRTNPISAD
jgi:hypothetical protein